MKKISERLCCAALLGLTAAAAGAQTPIRVTVNGDTVAFPEAQPVVRQGRVLVPLRGVFEKMGAAVNWNSYNREVTADKDPSHVQLRIGYTYAMVNGSRMPMDVPATIIRGNTMVPLRFVSEALGATVAWHDQDQTAQIMTGAVYNSSTTATYGNRSILAVNSVIPVTLSTALSSNGNQAGDPFSADVRTSGQDSYAGLPQGSRIEGHVVAARPKNGNEPGLLQLGFDRIIFPDGTSSNLNGSLVGLDSSSVTRSSNGTLEAVPGKATSRNPFVYVGYGAGGGAVLALLTKGNLLTDAVIGGALGYLLDAVQKNGDSNKARDVNLARGTEFGVRLDAPIQG